MNVTKSKPYLFTSVICTNKFQLNYVRSWTSLKNEGSTAVYSTKYKLFNKAYPYPVTIDVFCTKKPVNETKQYTFKQFALKIDWYKKECIDEDKNEEKEAMLGFYEILKSSLTAHSQSHHTRELERFGGLSLHNPPTIKKIIPRTQQPFNECAFEDKGVVRAFDHLCDVMEKNYINGVF